MTNLNPAALIGLVVEERRTLAQTTAHRDPNLSREGEEAYRRNVLAGMRSRLAAAMPAEPPMPDRGPVLEALRAQNADDLAFQAREWAKVRALEEAGRSLPQIIATADRTRLAAILDNLETSPRVLAIDDPQVAAKVVEEVHDLVWDRLVEVDPAAEAVASEERASAPVLAWRTILEGLQQTGEVPYEGLEALHATDPAAYRLLVDGDRSDVEVPGSGYAVPTMVKDLDAAPAGV